MTIIISIKREIAATENRIPDNINRITSWRSRINICVKNYLSKTKLGSFYYKKSIKSVLLIYINIKKYLKSIIVKD